MSEIFTKRVAQSSHDGRLYWTGSAWSFSASTGEHWVGYYSATAYKGSTFQLFPNVTIPKDATILSAKLTLRASYSNAEVTVKSKIRAAAQDNPTAPTSADDYLARPLTQATVNWDDIPTWYAGTIYDSPAIAAVIQEIVNRPGWQSGNAILIFWDDRDDRSTHAASRWRRAGSYDYATTTAPLLTVEYSVAPPEPEIETLDAKNIKSDQADLSTKVINDQGKTLSVRHNYGKTTEYGTNTPWVEGRHTDDIITQTVTDLDPETEYHFRGEAVYED